MCHRSTDKKCRQMHSCLSMNLFATFAFLLPGHPTLSTTFDYLKQRKKTAEKIDTNAQWFHCSWSILLKRVNIRVRRFHLVLNVCFWARVRSRLQKKGCCPLPRLVFSNKSQQPLKHFEHFPSLFFHHSGSVSIHWMLAISLQKLARFPVFPLVNVQCDGWKGGDPPKN